MQSRGALCSLGVCCAMWECDIIGRVHYFIGPVVVEKW